MLKANKMIELLESVIGIVDNPMDMSGYVQGSYITCDILQDDPKYYEVVSVGPKTILCRDPDDPSKRYNFPIEKTAIVDMQTPYTDQELQQYAVGSSIGTGQATPQGGKESQDYHNRNWFSGDIDLGVAGARTPRDKINQLRSMRPGLSKSQPKNKKSLIKVRDKTSDK
jgi:hypothetical protein